jgi:hypothetical protein
MRYIIQNADLTQAVRNLEGTKLLDVAYCRDTHSTHAIIEGDTSLPSMKLTQKSEPIMKQYLCGLRF